MRGRRADSDSGLSLEKGARHKQGRRPESKASRIARERDSSETGRGNVGDGKIYTYSVYLHIMCTSSTRCGTTQRHAACRHQFVICTIYVCMYTYPVNYTRSPFPAVWPEQFAAYEKVCSLQFTQGQLWQERRGEGRHIRRIRTP